MARSLLSFSKRKKFITSIEFKNNGPILLLKTLGTETVSCRLLLRMERWTGIEAKITTKFL